jgi:hypothetical protein
VIRSCRFPSLVHAAPLLIVSDELGAPESIFVDSHWYVNRATHPAGGL